MAEIIDITQRLIGIRELDKVNRMIYDCYLEVLEADVEPIPYCEYVSMMRERFRGACIPR